jgi:hypothetical protein
MAKKAVASLQTGSKKLAKAIRMVKKDGSSSYSFEERILPQDLVNDWLAGKPIVKKEAPKPVNQLQKKLRLKSQLQKKLRLKSQLQKKLRLKSQLQKKLGLKSQLQKKLRLKSQLQKKLRLKSQLQKKNLNNSVLPTFLYLPIQKVKIL